METDGGSSAERGRPGELHLMDGSVVQDMPVTCSLVEETDLEALYLAGRLPSRLASRFEDHCRRCARCRRLLRRARDVRAGLRRQPRYS